MSSQPPVVPQSWGTWEIGGHPSTSSGQAPKPAPKGLCPSGLLIAKFTENDQF